MIRSLSGTPMWTDTMGEWIALVVLVLFVLFLLWVFWKEEQEKRQTGITLCIGCSIGNHECVLPCTCKKCERKVRS